MNKKSKEEIIKILKENYTNKSIFKEDWSNLKESSKLLSCGEPDKVLFALGLGSIDNFSTDDLVKIYWFDNHDVFIEIKYINNELNFK